MTAFIFFVCLISSTVGGVCGIGGGVVIKPLLDAVGVMSVSTCSFLSGLTVLAMAVVNLWRNRRSEAIDLRCSLPLGIGAAIGGIIGKQIFQALKTAVGSDSLAGLIQSAVLGILMLSMLLYVKNKYSIQTHLIKNPCLCTAAGSVLGVLSSFLGIGGGPMNLAVLSFLFSMDTRQAAVNSILIILLSQLSSLGLTLVSGTVPPFDWHILIVMVTGGVFGGLLSASLQRRLVAAKVDALFSAVLLVIFVLCLYHAASSWGAI